MVQRKKSGYHLLVGAIVCLILGIIIDIGVLNYLVSISECESVKEEKACERLPQSKKTQLMSYEPLTLTLEANEKNEKNIDKTTGEKISQPTTSNANCRPKTNAKKKENIKEPPPYVEMLLKAEVLFAINSEFIKFRINPHLGNSYRSS